jgi:hypothetical protein
MNFASQFQALSWDYLALSRIRKSYQQGIYRRYGSTDVITSSTQLHISVANSEKNTNKGCGKKARILSTY